MEIEIEKSKVIDIKVSETSTNKPEEKKKLSFGEKFVIFLSNINKNIDKMKKKQIERSEREIERLERLEKKTKLEAKIAKNKAQGGKKNKSNNDIDWLKF